MGEPCLSLQQYASNPSQSLNVELTTEGGNHILPEQGLHFDPDIEIDSFTMTHTVESETIICTSPRTRRHYSYFRYATQYAWTSGVTFSGSISGTV